MNEKNPFNTLLDYERRLTAINPSFVEKSVTKQEWTSIGFKVGTLELLGDMGLIKEIIDPVPCTQIPGTKSWFLGVSNLRGGLISVTDLHGFAFNSPPKMTSQSKWLVCGTERERFALLVDSVLGMKRFYQEDKLQSFSETENEEISPFVYEAYKEQEKIWPVFNILRFINSQKFLNVAA